MAGRLRRIILLLLLITGVDALPAFGACQLGRLAQLNVNMVGLRPTVTAKINGTDVVFAVDSGAFFGMIAPAAARQLGLRLSAPLSNLQINGIGGRVQYSVATVDFQIGQFHSPKMDFVVGGNTLDGAQGLLGENILRAADAEYDLADGVIRLIRPGAGCKHTDLAYWATKDQAISVVPIDSTSLQVPLTQGIAYLNGKKIRVLFDTGASLSMLSLRAAVRAGVTPTDPGVMAIGYTFGLGSSGARTWIAPFDSFKLGGEEIRHTHLRIVDLGASDVDMYIGADFFLSHHVYIAERQHRIYFTYNGGPVFNLTAYLPQTRANPALSRAPPAVPPATEAGNPPVVQQAAAAPASTPQAQADAAQFARLGAGLAARGEFPQAIADLTRACQLDPSDANYFEQRGIAELRTRQPIPARADFDQAIRLNPNDVRALFGRAQLRFGAKDRGGFVSDLQAIDSTLTPQADERFALGTLYLQVDQYAVAVKQYSLWLDAHRGDIGVSAVLNQRCWARALSGQELKQALADCDRAIATSPVPVARVHALESRGFARLRLGDYAGSIKDYNAALKIQPRLASSLYGRGIDELRQGRTSAGDADVQAAVAEQPGVGDELRRAGVSP